MPAIGQKRTNLVSCLQPLPKPGILIIVIVGCTILGGLIAYFQPQREGTLVLRTINGSEKSQETVLREIMIEDGQRYLWSAK